MFEQSILSGAQTRKTRAVALAFVVQLVAVGAMILIPLLYLQPLPLAELTTMLVVPPPPPPPAPAAARTRAAVPRRFDASRLLAPRVIPKTITAIQDLPVAPPSTLAGGIPGGVEGGQVGGMLGGILGSVPSIAPPPPPVNTAEPPKPAPAKSDVIVTGGRVEAARLLSAPNPKYPTVAKDARIQGTVVMDAIIGKDGHIENLKAVSGSPLLIGAAMDAVKQWTYRPTYLNGRAVEVKTEIDLQFTLSG